MTSRWWYGFGLLAVLALAGSSAARHWVWFTDKGVNAPVDDAPVHGPYVRAVDQIAPVHVETRWFNGVSVTLDAETARAKRQTQQLLALPFVRTVEPVGRYRAGEALPPSRRPAAPRSGRGGTLDYGSSYQQVSFVKADRLHAAGYDGSGITIAIFDNGFMHYRTHSAFEHLNVAATLDVVDGDMSVDTASTDQLGSHGTQVLGCVGGYAPGNLIGTAWNATFLLARTETNLQEMPFEEDNWAAAAEWAYLNGADIISTSVGYNWFDDRSLDHTLDELDGKTTIISRAAQKAAARGIAVFACVGNERNICEDEWGNPDRTMTLLFPSDGDSVIGVGNIRFNGTVSSSSSLGPTADGRIKPDIAAPGSGVRTAYGADMYSSVYGTSFSTPISAGVGALLLQMHPEWDPIELRTALRASGSQWMHPDIYLGWGNIDAQTASRADSIVFGQVAYDSSGARYGAGDFPVRVLGPGDELVAEMLTSTGDGWFRFDNLPAGDHTLHVAQGDFAQEIPITVPSAPRELRIVIPIPVDATAPAHRPSAFTMGTGFPNPANPTTTFRYEAPAGASSVTMAVFSLAGQQVFSRSATVSGARGTLSWHGRDERGSPVGSGVYLVRFTTEGIAAPAVWRRVVLAR